MSPFRHRVLFAAVLPVALLLSACSGNGDSTATGGSSAATASQAAAESGSPSPATATVAPELEDIKATGADGKPTIEFPSTPFTSSSGYRVLTEGDGEDLTAGQTAITEFLLLSGKDGKEIESSYAINRPATLSLGSQSVLGGIRGALVGQKVGARVLVAMPVSDVSPQAAEQLKLDPKDTLVYYFKVTGAKTPLPEATGKTVAPKAGLPTVTMGATTKDPAQIAPPQGTPPTTTVAQPLIVGNGPKVAKGQMVRVSYTGVTWRNPKNPFDYSGKTPERSVEFPVGVGSLIKAWDEKLVGQPVGSRLLLVVPPADGYGAKGSPPAITGTDTLIFVLDILDAN